jgi:hydroxyacylglutathione hydrolase
MIFRQVAVGTFQNFAYVIGDDKTKTAAIVDPAWDVERLLRICEENGLKVSYVINTHSHHDHVQGNELVVKRTGARIVAHEKSPVRKDIAVKEGDSFPLGSIMMQVIHTPGHCPDHICVLAEGKLLSGDTLFIGECGRTDLAGGSSSDLYDSLNRLLKLPDSTEVYPGHDYGSKQSSTIGYEKEHNYTLKRRTREEFIKFMSEP